MQDRKHRKELNDKIFAIDILLSKYKQAVSMDIKQKHLEDIMEMSIQAYVMSKGIDLYKDNSRKLNHIKDIVNLEIALTNLEKTLDEKGVE